MKHLPHMRIRCSSKQKWTCRRRRVIDTADTVDAVKVVLNPAYVYLSTSPRPRFSFGDRKTHLCHLASSLLGRDELNTTEVGMLVSRMECTTRVPFAIAGQ